MPIETWTTWANRNGKSCVYLGHPTSPGRKFLRRSQPFTRQDLLLEAGFRQVSNDGMLEDCTRRTDDAKLVLPPKEAVLRFLEFNYTEEEYRHAVYYRDHADYYGLVIWIKP